MVKPIQWNEEKNNKLKMERNITFEDVSFAVENNMILDIIQHPNKEKYSNQKVLIFKHLDYCYMVPYVEEEDYIFLKTIIPSRKLTKKYLQK